MSHPLLGMTTLDALAHGAVVGRLFKGMPVAAPWMVQAKSPLDSLARRAIHQSNFL
jgi:hypothetical protein